MIDISVVIPVYKGRYFLDEITRHIAETISSIPKQFEIIYVDDCCPQNSWEIITSQSKIMPYVRGIRLSRNFGQHQAISAGLSASRGEWIVVMDCDLQDDPQEIAKLYAKAIEGYDVVFAKWENRKVEHAKAIRSRVFFWFLNMLSDAELSTDSGHFGIYSRRVISEISGFKDQKRWLKGMVEWIGLRVAYCPVVRHERKNGKSSYNLLALLRFAGDIIVLSSIRPLKLLSLLGAIIMLLTVAFIVYIIYSYINHEITVLGWPSLIVSIWFFSGLNIFAMGVVGLYVGRIYHEVRGRPPYIIGETV